MDSNDEQSYAQGLIDDALTECHDVIEEDIDSKTVTKEDDQSSLCDFTVVVHCDSEETSSDEWMESAVNTDPNFVHFPYKMHYHHFYISIFQNASQQGSKWYFYEPIVLLDPHSIASQSSKATGQHYVRFKLEMWSKDLHVKVIDFIKERTDEFVELQNVQLMPYGKIQLVKKSFPETGKRTYRLPQQPIPYQRMNETLQFYLLCDSKEATDSLADDLSTDPEFTMRHLGLECSWMSKNEPSTKAILYRQTFSINVPEKRLDLDEPGKNLGFD